jgi:hypothetical protein
MTDEPTWFRADLEPGVDDDERARLWSIADALIGGRPYPSAAFRGALRQRLAALRGTSGARQRPHLLWARVASLAVPGVVLLCLVAIGVGHAGPFAP